jgi:hypothetical protein
MYYEEKATTDIRLFKFKSKVIYGCGSREVIMVDSVLFYREEWRVH